jgi:hypothetical protein
LSTAERSASDGATGSTIAIARRWRLSATE